MRSNLFSSDEPFITVSPPAQGESFATGNELWSQEKVHFEQLPSLQDLFCICEHEVLCRVLMEDFAGWGVPRGAAQRKAAQSARSRMKAALDVMCSLEIPEQVNSRAFLPRETFEFSESLGVIVRYVDVALVDFSRTSQVRLARDELNAGAADGRAAEELYGALSRYDMGITGVATCSREPWENVLATRVWMHHGLCARERYLMLASAFWEMTRRGVEGIKSEVRGESRDDSFDNVSRQCFQDCEAVDADDPWPADPYGLLDLGDFDRAYRAKLRLMAADANHKAFVALLDGQLDAARRLGIAA